MDNYTPGLSNPLANGKNRLDAILKSKNGIIVFDSGRTYPGQVANNHPFWANDGSGDAR